MAEDFMSGEQHHALHSQQKTKRKFPNNFTNTKMVMVVVVGVILAGLGFYGGVQYQKIHQQSTASGLGGTAGRMSRGRFAGRRATFGQVTTVSTSSITIQTQSGSSVVYGITSSTTITSSGQTATTSDIKVGDSVAVIANSSDASQAARILINPNFGGQNAPTSNNTAPTVTN